MINSSFSTSKLPSSTSILNSPSTTVFFPGTYSRSALEYSLQIVCFPNRRNGELPTLFLSYSPRLIFQVLYSAAAANYYRRSIHHNRWSVFCLSDLCTVFSFYLLLEITFQIESGPQNGLNFGFEASLTVLDLNILYSAKVALFTTATCSFSPGM